MNKLLSSLLFLSHAIIFTHAAATVKTSAPFEKLRPRIIKEAKAWAQSVTNTLSKDLQLTYLNFFALNSEQSIPALIKCAEHIEAHKEMIPSSEQLGSNIMEKIKKYAERIEEKIAQKSDLTEQEEEIFWQKLEIKIQELVAYINAIYYEILYNYMYTETDSSPVYQSDEYTETDSSPAYMFDEYGIIQKEKRTKLLPRP